MVSFNKGTLDAYSTIITKYLYARNLTLTGSLVVGGNLLVSGSISGSNISGGSGDMTRAVYDTNLNGVVDNSETLNGLSLSQVRTHAPAAHSGSHAVGGGDTVYIAKSQITDLDNTELDVPSIVTTGTIYGPLVQAGTIEGTYLSGSISISGSSFIGDALNVTSIAGSTLSGSSILGDSATITNIIGSTISGSTISGSTYKGSLVTGIGISGSSVAYSDIYLQPGANITLSRTGQYISIISTASGSSGSVAGTTVVDGTTYGLSPVVGVDSTYAREDHSHGTPSLSSANPSDIGLAANPGSVPTGSKIDHVHRGVLSIANSGSSDLYSRVYFTGSGTVSLSETGQIVTISGSSPLSVGNFFGGTITGSYLYGTTITGSSISGSTVLGASANFTNITAVNVTGSSSVSGSSLYGLNATITNITGSTISGSTYLGASAIITNATFVNVTGSSLVSGSNFLGPTATITNINTTNLSGNSVTGNTLSGSNITGPTATITSITASTLTGSTISGTFGTFGSIVATTITGSTISGSFIGTAQFTNFNAVNITGSYISGSFAGPSALITEITANDVTGSNSLSGSNIYGKNAVVTNITATNITGSNISGSFIGPTAAITAITAASVMGSSLYGSAVYGDFGSFTNVTGSNLVSGSNFRGASATITNISGSNLTSTIIVGSTITGSTYLGSLVRSIAKSGSSAVIGNVTLEQGSSILLTQTGNNIKIDSTAGSGTPSDTVTSELAYGQTSAGGAATTYSRGDHTHGTPSLASANPLPVGLLSLSGSSTSGSRADHVHQGVLSVANSGSSALYGPIYFTGSSGNTVSQSGQVITISGTTSSTFATIAMTGDITGSNLFDLTAVTITGSTSVSGSSIYGATATITNIGATNVYATTVTGSTFVSGSTIAANFARIQSEVVGTLTGSTLISGSSFLGPNAIITNITATQITGSFISGSDHRGPTATITTLNMTNAYTTNLSGSGTISGSMVRASDFSGSHLGVVGNAVITGNVSGSTLSGSITQNMDGNARVAIRKNTGGVSYTRRRLNFIEGTSVSMTIGEDAGNEEVDITINTGLSTHTGSFTINSGSTGSGNVAHGAGAIPFISLTPTSDTGGKRWWLSSVDATNFVVTIDSSYSSNISFKWKSL